MNKVYEPILYKKFIKSYFWFTTIFFAAVLSINIYKQGYTAIKTFDWKETIAIIFAPIGIVLVSSHGVKIELKDNKFYLYPPLKSKPPEVIEIYDIKEINYGMAKFSTNFGGYKLLNFNTEQKGISINPMNYNIGAIREIIDTVREKSPYAAVDEDSLSDLFKESDKIRFLFPFLYSE